MKIEFFINGGLIDTYTCESDEPTKDDIDRIMDIKYDIVRNFGYAPTVTVTPERPDAKLVVRIAEASVRDLVVANDGYCPCMIEKVPDTKCMCKEFREQPYPGLCHCGLYEKVWA